MELIAERGRRISVDELNTMKLLAHARQQAVRRKYDEMLIVDCDAHHYGNAVDRTPIISGGGEEVVG